MSSTDQINYHKNSDTGSISEQIKEPPCTDQLKRACTEVLNLHKKNKSLKESNIRLKTELEAALKENVFLNEIVHGIDALIYILQVTDDGTWEIVWASDQAEKLVGYSLPEIRARGTFQHYKDTYKQEHLNILDDSWNFYKKNTDDTFSGIYKRKHKNGKWVWIYGFGHISKRKPDGTPEQSLCIAFDFTNKINTDKNLRDLLNENLQIKNELLISNLTKREKQVLKLISLGLTNREAAKRLNISHHTIDSHRKKLLQKLHLKNTAALVRFATESGLV